MDDTVAAHMGVLGTDADSEVKFGEADLQGLLAPLDTLAAPMAVGRR